MSLSNVDLTLIIVGSVVFVALVLLFMWWNRRARFPPREFYGDYDSEEFDEYD